MLISKLHHSIASIAIVLFALSSCTAHTLNPEQNDFAELPTDIDGLDIATFAGGCFWCTEAVFERVEGVKYVISGYAGGDEMNPTYGDVGSGRTTHAESIQIYYDAHVVDFETLLNVLFIGAHDPTQVNRQGNDVGPQYRSVAFYRNQTEQNLIEKKIEELESLNADDKPFATQVVPFEKFYPAEKYHQDYYPHNPNNGYVQNVTRPKVEKFEKHFNSILKEEYKH